ncbi:MAG: hypothetical protein J6V91_05545 [Kiritimatiellae bacterium]|nr:hypothetical protein [Kiritimatiellia bacterium]
MNKYIKMRTKVNQFNQKQTQNEMSEKWITGLTALWITRLTPLWITMLRICGLRE